VTTLTTIKAKKDVSINANQRVQVPKRIQKFLFFLIKGTIGAIFFMIMYQVFIASIPDQEGVNFWMVVFSIFIASFFADVFSFFASYQLYPTGSYYGTNFKDVFKRLVTFVLQALVITFGLLFTISSAIFQDNVYLQILFGWIIVNFFIYMISEWAADKATRLGGKHKR
jgi:hypothetical protein